MSVDRTVVVHLVRSPNDGPDAKLMDVPVPVFLIHGASDTVMDAGYTRTFFAALEKHGWPASLDVPDTDHAGAAMTAYDAELDLCGPTTAEHALRAGALTARTIARAAG